MQHIAKRQPMRNSERWTVNKRNLDMENYTIALLKRRKRKHSNHSTTCATYVNALTGQQSAMLRRYLEHIAAKRTTQRLRGRGRNKQSRHGVTKRVTHEPEDSRRRRPHTQHHTAYASNTNKARMRGTHAPAHDMSLYSVCEPQKLMLRY